MYRVERGISLTTATLKVFHEESGVVGAFVHGKAGFHKAIEDFFIPTLDLISGKDLISFE
jgi:hypothetical protein